MIYSGVVLVRKAVTGFILTCLLVFVGGSGNRRYEEVEKFKHDDDDDKNEFTVVSDDGTLFGLMPKVLVAVAVAVVLVIIMLSV